MFKRGIALLCAIVMVAATPSTLLMETAYAQEVVPVVTNGTAPETLTVSGRIENITNSTGGMSAKKDDRIRVIYALSDCDWAKKADSKAILGFNLTVKYDEAVLEFVPKSGKTPSEENMLVKTNLGVDGNKCPGELLLLGAATAVENSWEAVPGDFFDLDFKVISKTNEDVSIAIEIKVSYGSFSGTIKTATVNAQPIPKFTIDNTAPKISLDGEVCTADTAKLDYSPVIVRAADETSNDVTMTLDGKAFTSGTSFNATTGVFTATDSAKNTATLTLTVDTTKLNELQNIINALVVDVNKMDYAKTSTIINEINDKQMKLSLKAQAKLKRSRYIEAVRVLGTIETAIKTLDTKMLNLNPNSIKFDSNIEINAINGEADKLLANNNVAKSVESYKNFLNFTNATANYKTEITDKLAAVKTDLAKVGVWAYADAESYKLLSARIAELKAKSVPDTQYDTAKLKLLNENIDKSAKVDADVIDVKTLIEALPAVTTVKDLAAIETARKAYDKLKTVYALTDEEIKTIAKVDLFAKLTAAEGSVKVSQKKITDAVARIDALYNTINGTDYIKAGVETEIVDLVLLTETAAEGADRLTQDEINALKTAYPEKITKLASAKQDFAKLTTAIVQLNNTFKTFTNITYANKTDLLTARTKYNTLKTNHSTTEAMFTDYNALTAAEKIIAGIDAEIASVKTALTNIGDWSYGNNETYINLRARVTALVTQQVPENTFDLTALANFENKITAAQTAMTAFKTAVNAIPKNPDAGDLNLVKAAETAYLKLGKDFNLSTTDINKYLNEATTIKTYEAAIKALADSLAKIEAVEKRIAALYNGADIIYGKTEEMKVLASILDGTYTGTDKLTAVEIGAVKAESKTQLSEAPDKVNALIKSINDLNTEIRAIKQASYKVKADATALRTRLTALNTANKVPVDTATFKDLDNLIKTEKFIENIEKEMVSVKAAYAAIPSKDAVKVTQKEELETLNARYDALLKLDVTAEQIGADKKRYTDALAGIDKVWDDVKALDKSFLKLPTAEKTLYTDKKLYNETVLELERITARGVEQTDANYINYSKYTAFKDAFSKLQGKVDNILSQISSIKPWKYGNNSIYSKLIDEITSLKVFGIEITDLPTAGEIKVAQDMQNAAEIIVNDICAKAKVLPVSVTRADKAAVDAIVVQMDKLRAAPYSMPDKDLKMAVNNKYGTDIFTKIAQAITVVNTPEPTPEPTAPVAKPKPKPNKKPVVNKDNNNDTEQPILKAEGGTNITLQPTKGVELPKGVKLIANEINEENQKDFMEKAKSSIKIIGEELDGTVGKIAMFDISLELNGKKIQPNGKVQITIAVPKGFDGKKIAVFYVSDDGKAEKLEAIVKDGKIIFETDHFSYYSIVELTVEKEASSASSSVESAASEKPVSSQAEITEHSNNLVIIIALVVALAVVAILVVIVIIRKRNNPQ